jgi:hypothetical protein
LLLFFKFENPRFQKKESAGEYRRGRYWNYEHNRWSFCSGEAATIFPASRATSTDALVKLIRR